MRKKKKFQPKIYNPKTKKWEPYFGGEHPPGAKPKGDGSYFL